MRLKRSRLKQYSHRQAIPRKDNEGNSYVEYGPPSSFDAEVWPAGGKLQAEMYGQRLPYIRNCRIDGSYEINPDEHGVVHYVFRDFELAEGDGICLNVPSACNPDYRIIAVRPYVPLFLEMERI